MNESVSTKKLVHVFLVASVVTRNRTMTDLPARFRAEEMVSDRASHPMLEFTSKFENVRSVDKVLPDVGSSSSTYMKSLAGAADDSLVAIS